MFCCGYGRSYCLWFVIGVCVYVTRCCIVCLVLEPPRTTIHYYSANDVPTRVSCPMFACCHCTMYYTRGRVFHYIAVSGSIPVAVNVISCFDSCFEHWSWNHPNRTSHSCAAKGMTPSVSCLAWTCSVPTMLYMCSCFLLFRLTTIARRLQRYPYRPYV